MAAAAISDFAGSTFMKWQLRSASDSLHSYQMWWTLVKQQRNSSIYQNSRWRKPPFWILLKPVDRWQNVHIQLVCSCSFCVKVMVGGQSKNPSCINTASVSCSLLTFCKWRYLYLADLFWKFITTWRDTCTKKYMCFFLVRSSWE